MMTGEKTEWTREEMEAMKNDHMMMSGSDTKMDPLKKEEKIKKEDSKMMKVTGYMNYDEVTVKTALTEWQKVALFFHASWCPTCKALNTAIESDLSSIPVDTLIVKVDYDTNDELKKKYGVTTQHTTVLIDHDMNLISKKLWARNIAEILN